MPRERSTKKSEDAVKHAGKHSSEKRNWLRDYGAVLAALAALAVLFALVASVTQPAPQAAPQATPNKINPQLMQTPQTSPTANPSSQQSKSGALKNTAQAAALAAATQNGRAMLSQNASVNAVFLDATQLAGSAKKYPVVYANLGADAERFGVFEVRFAVPASSTSSKRSGQGLLSIVGVDASGKPTSVLREFPVLGFNFS
jgi:hypothetical protein